MGAFRSAEVRMIEIAKNNPLAILTIAGAGYLALGRWKNLQEGQGCPKCEKTQLVVSLGLVAFAAYTLWRVTR